MKKAFGYVRTATKVASEFNSIENQTKLIKDYCEKNNIELVKVYSDPAKSGIKPNRPALHRLLRKVDKTQANFIVITEPDRLSRSVSEFLTIKSLLRKAGVEILTVNHGLAKTDPFETLVNEMFATVNAFYPKIRAMKKSRRHYRCKNA